MSILNNKDNSPFTPGSPVPVELFEGRAEKILEVTRYIKQSASGRLENIFLLGDRGIGKSSLASFIRFINERDNDILGVHVHLNKVITLEEMVRYVFEQILKATKKEKWFNKISKFFGENISQVGLFGVSMTFSPKPDDLKKLVWNFPEALENLINEIKQEKKGVFIALDDINGLAEQKEFANWYKSFADEIATSGRRFPVTMMMIGLPEKRITLYKLQPSLMRIFRIIEIEKLSDSEVTSFFRKAFRSVAIDVTDKAIKTMVGASSGQPMFMHEIGDATYWIDDDNAISFADAVGGIIIAADRIGKKYLDPSFYQSVRSPRYKAMLRKFGNLDYPESFTKNDIEKMLTENERKVFNNFMQKLKKLGIVESDQEKGKGAYKFVNSMYPLYIKLEAGRYKSK